MLLKIDVCHLSDKKGWISDTFLMLWGIGGRSDKMVNIYHHIHTKKQVRLFYLMRKDSKANGQKALKLKFAYVMQEIFLFVPALIIMKTFRTTSVIKCRGRICGT